MDDSFAAPHPAQGDDRADLPRLPDGALGREGLEAFARRWRKPGARLTLVATDGTVLFDPEDPQAFGSFAARWTEVSRALVDSAVHHAAGGTEVAFEVVAPASGRDHPLRWWRLRMTPVLSRSGTGVRLLKVLCEDVTGRMDQLHRKARPDWLPGASGVGSRSESG